MITEAAILTTLRAPLLVAPITIPALKTGQVLVDVAYSGICHTQLSEVRGKRGEDKFLPHTLGHEGSGIVRALGDGVSKVSVGDHVVLTWIKGIGADVGSTHYTGSIGAINSGAISTLMRTTVISENRVVKVAPELPLREAALLGCAVPTGAGIIFNTAKITQGSSVAIFGAGGIGLAAILAAKAAGASMIIAIDIFDHKLQQAKALGATHLCNAKTTPPLQAILQHTSNRGVDFSVECAGHPETMENAFRAVADKGGLCILAGNVAFGETISINPFDLIRGKKIMGTWGGETDPDRDIPQYAERYLNKNWDISQLVSHEFSLAQVNDAFDALERGEVARAIIKM
jgi:S-(hydroxymethyl)glutathione dehydrogenase/alcohol dehydrogenase